QANNHTLHHFPTRRSSDLFMPKSISPSVRLNRKIEEADSPVSATRVSALPAPSVVGFKAETAVTERVGPTPINIKPALPCSTVIDRKSTRLNSSHGSISYA